MRPKSEGKLAQYKVSEFKTLEWQLVGPNMPTSIIIIIIIKDIYIAQVHKGHKYPMSAEMAVWLRNCLCLYTL